MATVEINAGICGFTTLVQAEAEETLDYTATLRLQSECPNWQKVAALIGGDKIDVMAELFVDRETKTLHSRILDIGLKTIPHVSCPVISGILKAMEVSVGLALPKDAGILFRD